MFTAKAKAISWHRSLYWESIYQMTTLISTKVNCGGRKQDFISKKKNFLTGQLRPFTSNHLGSPPTADFLSLDSCFTPRRSFASAITSPPDRIALANSNVISQCTEGTEAAPVPTETSYHTHSPSLLFHWVNKAQPCRLSPRRRLWCKKTDGIFFFVCVCGDLQKLYVITDGQSKEKHGRCPTATKNLQQHRYEECRNTSSVLEE